MGLYNKLAEDLNEVDIIIAGGGTAGCIIAARVAEEHPDLSVLVIEQGANNKDVPHIVNPVFYLQNLQPTAKTALFYKGNKAPQLADREPIVPCGGTLGGGSSINFMMYTRAQRSDFDSWKAEGWSADDMWPHLKRLETYHGPGKKEHHGYDGPINISDGGFRAKDAEDDFMKASAETGYAEIEDLQNLDNNDGFQRWQRYVSPDGKRQDTAHRYLHPKLEDGQHKNLHVLVESKVDRVIFDDNKRAVGVEYTPNPEFQAVIGLTGHPTKTVKARKLVVVTCGACGTPPVLERSGVGDSKFLARAGVKVVEELRGVGKDYQDHHLLLYPYRTNLNPDQTIDRILSGRVDAAELVKNNDKEDVDALGPEFRKAWDRDFKDIANRPLMLMGVIQCFLGDPASVPEGQYVTTGCYTAYPYSRGHLHITGSKPDDPLDFDVGFFNDADDIDLKKQIWAYKKQREIMRRAKYYRGELAAGHPKFPEGSAAACVELSEPLKDVKDIVYSKEDDAAIEQWLRENVNTTWHSMATCKMAPKEQDGVVDSKLNVYGVQGLKLADLSIAPENVGANTNNTALAVGEKAASIILAELKA
ncbi:GMC oxidoreductase-domain-containing protein [Paraphoma chrysanthemicola]|nr:GMC oxidoreductase-domain-containing protein [Paraphoma chrysanthemicola]